MSRTGREKRYRTGSQEVSSQSALPGKPAADDAIGWSDRLAALCLWTLGLSLMFACAWSFAWLTNEIHESTLYFSSIKEVEREISLRTEQGLYYSYYKQLVQAPTLRQGLAQLVYNNVTEHPDTINVLQRMNIYQEVVLGLLYRCTLLGRYFQPIYFYIYSVLFLNGLLICGLFGTAWYLTGSPLAGCLASVMYTLNSAHTTRLSSTHALREHFSLPFLWLQILCLTVYFNRSTMRGSLREKLTLRGVQICCFLFTLFWQFNQFLLLLQSLSVLAASAIGFVQFRKAYAFLLSASASLLAVSAMQFGNPMLLTAPALSVCLAGALSVYASRRWLSNFFLASGGRLGRICRVACQGWVFLLCFCVCQTGLKLLIRHEADSHIYKFVMMKLGYGYDDDFDVRMYNCAGAFVWLPWSTFEDLARNWLLQPYLLCHAVLFLLTFCGFLDYVFRNKAVTTTEEKLVGPPVAFVSSLWREVLDNFSHRPEFAYHAVQCTVFGILGYTTLRMKFFWTAYMCILMTVPLSHKGLWEWLFAKLNIRLKHAALCWSQVLTIALLATSIRTCYRDNLAVWDNLKEFWDPDTVQLMEWITKETPSNAAFTGSMQLLAGVKCCTERRITNHPHYEDSGLRDKTRRLYQIYGRKSPEEVHQILRSFSADYIILEDSICLKPENGCGTTELVDNLNGELTDLQGKQASQAAGSLKAPASPRFCNEIRHSHGRTDTPYGRLFKLVLENRTFRVYRVL